ncbi:MAG: SpoIVB peptidase [Clostridia bacterium]|nr:SpoIVB peptidase [Clostridia bacterium]
MKIARGIIKGLFFGILALSVLVFVLIFMLSTKVSDNYKINKNQNFSINTSIPVRAVYNGCKPSQKQLGQTYQVDLKMFGVIPFSTTTVQVVDKKHVAVLGTPFGMKMYSNGVLVVDIQGVDTKSGKKDVAEDGGLKVGDYIKSVDGLCVSCNEDLLELVKKSGGNKMIFKILRSGKEKKISVKPVKEKTSGEYRVGIWVRDSSAGIGTLTFYSPYNNMICGLGHEVNDCDTGKRFDFGYGEMVKANIISVTKGKTGTPGELVGGFSFETISNKVTNEENGIYGALNGKISVSTLTEVALKQDVKNGEAQILTTVSGETPKLYSCKVALCPDAYKTSTQNFTVQITDKELLSKTGGIVQGMSGSPILQNGKLIGAATHVFLDDPTMGYAIFAENMLETAQSVANENKLKDAS